MTTSSNLWENKTQGVNYDRYRPVYPTSLLQKIIPQQSHAHMFLDVATGTGQILFKLCEKFGKSLGADISQQMVEVSMAKAKEFNQRNGESHQVSVVLKDCLHIHEEIDSNEKFDLVTVGEALHWFQIDDFIKYVHDRLLKSDGIFGVLGYYISACEFLDADESQKLQANDIYFEYYNMIEPYFAFRMGQLDQAYCESKYTFNNHFKNVQRTVTTEPMDMSAEDFVKFFKTYSGYNTFVKQTGRDISVEMESKLKDRKVRMMVKYFLIKCSN